MTLSKALLTISLLFSTGTALIAGDEEDLKASFKAALESLNTKDLEGFQKAWHTEGVMFTRNRVFAFDLKEIGQEEWSRIFTDLFAGTTELSYTTSDVTYRVMGNVGLVWGLTELAFTVEGQPRQRQDVRLSATLIKSPPGWKIVSWHDSAFPKRLRGGPTQ